MIGINIIFLSYFPGTENRLHEKLYKGQRMDFCKGTFSPESQHHNYAWFCKLQTLNYY